MSKLYLLLLRNLPFCTLASEKCVDSDSNPKPLDLSCISIEKTSMLEIGILTKNN